MNQIVLDYGAQRSHRRCSLGHYLVQAYGVASIRTQQHRSYLEPGGERAQRRAIASQEINARSLRPRIVSSLATDTIPLLSLAQHAVRTENP